MFSIFLRQAETPALPELCLKKKLILVGQASVPVTMQLNKVFPKDTCRLPTAGALGKNGG